MRILELRQANEQGAAVEVLDPKGARALTLDEATRAQNMPLTMAGFYDVKRPNGRHELVAVNADRRESDLDVISGGHAGIVAEYGSGAAECQLPEGDAKAQAHGILVVVLLAVLALAVAESLLGNRHLRGQHELSKLKRAKGGGNESTNRT